MAELKALSKTSPIRLEFSSYILPIASESIWFKLSKNSKAIPPVSGAYILVVVSAMLGCWITDSKTKAEVSASLVETIWAIVSMVYSSAYVIISVKIWALKFCIPYMSSVIYGSSVMNGSSSAINPLSSANSSTAFFSSLANILAAFFSAFLSALANSLSSLVNFTISWSGESSISTVSKGSVSTYAISSKCSKISNSSSAKLLITCPTNSGLSYITASIINIALSPLVFIISSLEISAAVPSLLFTISVKISPFKSSKNCIVGSP